MGTIKLKLEPTKKDLIKLNKQTLVELNAPLEYEEVTKNQLIALLNRDKRYYTAIVDKSIFTDKEYIEINANIIKYIDNPSKDLIKYAIKWGAKVDNIPNLDFELINYALKHHNRSSSYYSIQDKLSHEQELLAITKSKGQVKPLSEDNLAASLYSLIYNLRFPEISVKDKEHIREEKNTWRFLQYLLSDMPDHNDSKPTVNSHKIMALKYGKLTYTNYSRLNCLQGLYWGLNRMKEYSNENNNYGINLIGAHKGVDTKLDYMNLVAIHIYNNPKVLVKYIGSLTNQLIYLAVYRDKTQLDLIDNPPKDLVDIANGNLSILRKDNKDFNLIRICENPSFIKALESPTPMELNLAVYLDNTLILEPIYAKDFPYEFYVFNPDLVLEKKSRLYLEDYLYSITFNPELVLKLDRQYIDETDLYAYVIMLQPSIVLKMNNPRKLYKALAILCDPSIFTELNDYPDDMKVALWLADDKLYNKLNIHCHDVDTISKYMKENEVKYTRFRYDKFKCNPDLLQKL